MIKQSKPKIIAHRGNCKGPKGLPENSEAAFTQACTCKTDGIETDVQLTKDDIPVLFHDRVSYKLTGNKKHIVSYTLNELMRFNYKKEKILTLEKAINLFCKKTKLYIEIKSRKIDRTNGRSRLLTSKVVDQVRNIAPEYRKNIYILSFDPDILKQVNTIADNINCILNLNGSDKWCIGADEILSKKFSWDHLTALCMPINGLTAKLVDFTHAHNMEMLTYSCNNEKQLNRILSLNVDGIMTDRAEWLVKRIKNEKKN